MPRPKGIGSRHKIRTGENTGRQQTTPRDNQCFNHKYSHLNSNKLSSLVIFVYLSLNNSVVNPHQLSSVCQQSSRYSQNTPRDNRCFNSKDSNSKSNDFSSPVITLPPPLNDLVINPPQLSSICQQSSSSSHNTTHELQDSSIPGPHSPDPSNTMSPLSTKNGSHNIYGCMSDVSNLTPTLLQQYSLMLIQNYHELCNINDPSSMFVSPPPIPSIESLSQFTVSSLDSGSFDKNELTWIFNNKLHQK